MLLVRSGRREDAYNLLHDELRFGRDPIPLLDEQFSLRLEQNELDLAGEYAFLLSAFRWGSAWHPAWAGGNRDPVFLMEGKVFLTVEKLIHDVEQLSYMRRNEVIGHRFDSVIASYEDLIEEMRAAKQSGPVALSEEVRSRIGGVYNRIIHIRPTPRVSKALSGRWNAVEVESDYLEGNTGFVVIDNFLSNEALESVRLFCLESTVWSGNRYNHGRLGAFFRDGFNCPLLIQIAEELQDALPRVIGRRYPLQQLWGFKTGQRLPANSTTHADFAAVNVNFWITPAEANLDENSGGLVIYDVQAPLNWDFHTYNGKLAVINSYLQQRKARSVRVPYKQNRAIIFNSDLFHATEAVYFRPEYENHRVNVTMLYGFRQDDVHHLDARANSAKAYLAWRSAAFRR